MQDNSLFNDNENSAEKCDQKYESDNSGFDSDDNDGLLSLSSNISNNEKETKNKVQIKLKRITKLDQIKICFFILL